MLAWWLLVLGIAVNVTRGLGEGPFGVGGKKSR
jgi:hypothetical protein